MSSFDVEMVKKVSDYCNCFGSNFSEFAFVMSKEHRTIQQNFTRICLEWLKELSNTEYFDDRNEASVMFAKSIKDQLDNTVLPYT